MRYRKTFYRHGCTEKIADQVIDYGVWYQLHDSERGNEQVMYIGWDNEGDKLWEIGIELFPNGQEDWAFHAQEATPLSIKRIRR